MAPSLEVVSQFNKHQLTASVIHSRPFTHSSYNKWVLDQTTEAVLHWNLRLQEKTLLLIPARISAHHLLLIHTYAV